MSSPLALYVHWPFCLSKCPYCDFNSHVGGDVDHALWAQALCAEMRFVGGWLRERDHASATRRQVTSVFFGGGTPSLMDPRTVAQVLECAQDVWGIAPEAEITLEANPTSFEAQKFADFRRAGIGRLSIGVQSLRDDSLRFLGRTHSAENALATLAWAQKHFERYSFDLIYARPEQTVQEWQEELARALSYAQGHMSLYQLTIERGTAFYARAEQGAFCMPDPDLSADLYLCTQDITARAGLPAYEISNHAARGQESLHNLTYWRYGDYVGIGPGAHGRIGWGFPENVEKYATRTHKAPAVWLSRVQDSGHGFHPFEAVPPRSRVAEALMMGLRLREGLPLSRLEQASGQTRDTLLPAERVHTLMAEGLITCEKDVLCATESGLLKLNTVTGYLLTGRLSGA